MGETKDELQSTRQLNFAWVENYFKGFHLANKQNSDTLSLRTSASVKWSASPSGMWKLNVDTAMKEGEARWSRGDSHERGVESSRKKWL